MSGIARGFTLLLCLLILPVLLPHASMAQHQMKRQSSLPKMLSRSTGDVSHPLLFYTALKTVQGQDEPVQLLARVVEQRPGDSGAWDNDYQTLISYNASKQRVQDREQMWDDRQQKWKNVFQYTYAYDDQERLSVIGVMWWHSAEERWVEEGQVTYAYRTDGAPESILWEDDDSGVDRFVFAYVDGVLSEFVWESGMDAGSMEINLRALISYHEDNITMLVQAPGFEGSPDKWVNVERITYHAVDHLPTFDWFTLMEPDYTIEWWEESRSAWHNVQQVMTTYDDAGRPDEQTRASWEVVGEDRWVVESRVTFTYEEDLLTVLDEQQWDRAEEAWETAFFRRTLHYETHVAAEREALPQTYTLGYNYPNPFNPTTSVSFTLPATEHVTLQVLDVMGREVARPVDGVLPAGQHSTTFHAEGLPSGVYLYRLSTVSYEQTRMMMLVK